MNPVYALCISIALWTIGAFTSQTLAQENSDRDSQSSSHFVQEIQQSSSFDDGSGSRTTTTGNNVSIKINPDGSVTAHLNGKEVPASRIRRDHQGNIIILDEQGQPIPQIGTFNINQPAMQKPMPAMIGHQQTLPKHGTLGIQTTTVDPIVAYHLQIDPTKAVMINHAVKGAAAEQAGLRKYDLILITAINGMPANSDQLQSVLRQTKPGDKVVLSVVRAGTLQHIEIPVSAYTPEILNEMMPAAGSWRLPQVTTSSMPPQTRMEDHMRQMQEQMQQQMLELNREFQQMQEQMQQQFNQNSGAQDDGQGRAI